MTTKPYNPFIMALLLAITGVALLIFDKMVYGGNEFYVFLIIPAICFASALSAFMRGLAQRI